MRNTIEYAFETEPEAYRFLNAVSHFDAPNLVSKFGQSSFHVKVEYDLSPNTFDSTLSELDTLAERYGGKES